MSFENLGLDAPLLRAIRFAGYRQPTEIQNLAVPLILAGADLCAQAQTGSGKTVAFALPLVQNALRRKPGRKQRPQVLTLAPTRELALQIASQYDAIALFAPHPVTALALVGGESHAEQIEALRAGVSVIVATPGRLKDLMDRGEVDLSDVTALVLDEADRMIDLGFAESLAQILPALPADRQTLLFSATLPKKLDNIIAAFLRNPETIRLSVEQPLVADVEHRVYNVDRDRRAALVQHLLRTHKPETALIFVASQITARRLAAKLRQGGIDAEEFHGKLAQDERITALQDFQDRHVRVLVATDLAARGIDVRALQWVVHYDLPRSAANFIHRCGRAGRAGLKGVALTLVGHEDESHFKLIQKTARTRFERLSEPGFERSEQIPELMSSPTGPVKGLRPSKKDKARAAAAAAANTTPESLG